MFVFTKDRGSIRFWLMILLRLTERIWTSRMEEVASLIECSLLEASIVWFCVVYEIISHFGKSRTMRIWGWRRRDTSLVWWARSVMSSTSSEWRSINMYFRKYRVLREIRRIRCLRITKLPFDSGSRTTFITQAIHVAEQPNKYDCEWLSWWWN